MERKIGEIFEVEGQWYQCVEANENDNCNACGLQGLCLRMKAKKHVGNCMNWRTDKKRTIFKKLEKVGEPYMDGGKIMQKYKRVYKEPIYFPYKELSCYNDLHGRICIEIKQNKEDMKEKKLTYEELEHYYNSTVGLWAINRSPQEVSLTWIIENAFQLGIEEKHSNSSRIGKDLKEFDLEAAKAGKPVCTRDGRKARIICFDRKHCHQEYDYPIVALISEGCYDESLGSYTKDGLFVPGGCYNTDLMMLPEKKGGYIHLKNNGVVFKDKETAVKKCPEGYIVAKVEWEE